MLSSRLPWQVLLMNDLSAAAWGERCVGAGEGRPDVLLVFVGSGVGSGIIANGELYEGGAGVAGELGHTKAVPGGRLCGCGERGCLEAYCGGHNLSAQVAEAVAAGRATTLDTTGGRTVGAAEIEKAALAGDALAKELWDNCQRLLSVAIANFTTLLNPSRVILGGGVLLRTPELKKTVAGKALELVSASARESVQFVDASLGDDAGVIGAGLRALSVATGHAERATS
jgi:glucokinase